MDLMDYTMDCLWTDLWTSYGLYNGLTMDYIMDCLWTNQWIFYGLCYGLTMDWFMDGLNFGLQMDWWMDGWTIGHDQIRYTPQVNLNKAPIELLFLWCPQLWTNYGLLYGLFMDWTMDYFFQKFLKIVACESSRANITLLSFQNLRNFQGVHIFLGSPYGWMDGLQSILWTTLWTVSSVTVHTVA